MHPSPWISALNLRTVENSSENSGKFQQTVENSSRDGNTRPRDLPPEKCVCRSSLMLKNSINICGGGPLAPEDSMWLNRENSFESSLLEAGQIMLSFRIRLSKICSHILLPLVWECMLFLFFEAATELGSRRWDSKLSCYSWLNVSIIDTSLCLISRILTGWILTHFIVSFCLLLWRGKLLDVLTLPFFAGVTTVKLLMEFQGQRFVVPMMWRDHHVRFLIVIRDHFFLLGQEQIALDLL